MRGAIDPDAFHAVCYAVLVDIVARGTFEQDDVSEDISYYVVFGDAVIRRRTEPNTMNAVCCYIVSTYAVVR